MPRSFMALAILVFALLAVAAAATREGKPAPAGPHAGMKATLYPASEIKWTDGPASLPKGAQIAVLEGDPAKEGPFVFRVKVPDGYRVPPHTHPKVERITVISGTFNIGMGERFDPTAMQPMPAGTYGYWPAGMAHFVSATGETILQFHGDGPWSIKYINPADDPRSAKAGGCGSGDCGRTYFCQDENCVEPAVLLR